MSHDLEKCRRRSIRLRGYDYTSTGAYFVTICAHGKVCLFGDIVDEKIRLNEAGCMIKKWWGELNRKFLTVETDEYIVMPNHFHGIIAIVNVGADLRVCPPSDTNTFGVHTKGTHTGVPLPEIVQWFKTMTTNEYIRGVKTGLLTPFAGRLWQRNYYEHIIRDDKSLHRIREYIASNPAQWELDRENSYTKTGIVPG